VTQKKLSIVADENMPYVEQMFAQYGDIKKVNGRTLNAQQLVGVDVLLVRSVTQVNEQLLAQSSIKFVGSATIGTDHIDKDYLGRSDISFASAPGCNANAVVEYDISCFCHLLSQSNESLIDKTVAIIGVGNVGQRLARRLGEMGVKVLLNDPPRAMHESGFHDLEYVLKQADIVALHTPLVKSGPHPSVHLLKSAELAMLKQGAILLNAGRGPTINNQDLLTFLKQRTDVRTVLDVWEHEPKVDPELAGLVSIATPHIAGYSLEGRSMGTYMLKEALCQWLGKPNLTQLEDFLPLPDKANLTLNKEFNPLAIISLVYDPFRDDESLRTTLEHSDQPTEFDLLRKNYPIRREFRSLKLHAENDSDLAYMSKLGFSVI